MASGAPQTIDLDTLGNADLAALKEQFEEELQGLVRSSVALQRAAGQALLLPLTSSVYVAGELASSSSVLVDIGTGYFVEQPVASASKYFARKLDYLKDQLLQLSAAVKDKQVSVQKITGALQRRMLQAQRAQAAA